RVIFVAIRAERAGRRPGDALRDRSPTALRPGADCPSGLAVRARRWRLDPREILQGLLHQAAVALALQRLPQDLLRSGQREVDVLLLQACDGRAGLALD